VEGSRQYFSTPQIDGIGKGAAVPLFTRSLCQFTLGNQHARLVGDLVAQTRPLGLSLGDRACLALALSLKAPVYTADKSWKKLKAGARIHIIR
jgi:PIN domain nuclease of toxin-antitoxin system